MSEATHDIGLIDLAPRHADFRGDVLRGLSRRPRRIPSQYLYDAAGADLFEEICRQPEYYPTQTELAIMRESVDEMARRIGPQAAVIEPGSGDGVKTRLLLDTLEDPASFAPVDIAREQLIRVAGELAEQHPGLDIVPICADFTRTFDSTELATGGARRRVIYFPGSTVGNFGPAARRRLLDVFRQVVGEGGGLLIGVDLRKDRRTLEAAYDDAAGVTASFNTNLLRRINRELEGDFDLDAFDYRANWCERRSRVEMSQVSRVAQTVTVADRAFEFAPDEAILTECSYKFSVEGFSDIASRSGWRREDAWLDDQARFAVMFFSAA